MEETSPQGGSYELLRQRLAQHGTTLAEHSTGFNDARLAALGGGGSELIGKANVITQARSVPVDMAQVDDLLLFGYQVFVGMKRTPAVQDVLGLYRLDERDGVIAVEPVPLSDSFLDDPRFRHSFTELFTYYKDARLVQIGRREQLVYVAFRIGARIDDLRVYRWEIGREQVRYLDDRGQAEFSEIPQRDISWHSAGRDHQVLGEHPHLSIQERVFVDCLGGTLSVRVEDNTAAGREIFSEPVEDRHQGLADAEVRFAEAGGLILLQVRPNRERQARGLIYNPITEQVTRADAIEHSLKLLPEDHGVLFANGFALIGGEVRLYDDAADGFGFFQEYRAPNGEDLLYVFFNPSDGAYRLLAYNLIEKRFEPPMASHGYSLFNDGRLLLFRLSDNAEASTIHPLRIWRTSFMTPDAYAAREHHGGDPFFHNIGNAELVRAISELKGIAALAAGDKAGETLFQTLMTQCRGVLESYHWLDEAQGGAIVEELRAILTAAERIINEYAKVATLKRRVGERLAAAIDQGKSLRAKVDLAPSNDAPALIALLADVRGHLGQAISLRELRYMDLDGVAAEEQALTAARDSLNSRLLGLLQQESAYKPFHDDIDRLETSLDKASKATELKQLVEEAATLRERLFIVNEEVAEIDSEDATRTTRILDLSAQVVARLNAVDARLKTRLDGLRTREAEAEFASQLKLLAQATTAALGRAATPNEADEQLARVLGLVERLETRFAEFDQFLAEIYAKRDEVQSSFEAHRQQLLATRQKRIGNMATAAEITAKGIEQRAERFDDLAALNAYFASDAMVTKLRGLAERIRGLDDAMRADAIDARLKAIQDRALRALRDSRDIFEQGGKVLKLGPYRFSVQHQALEPTLVPRADGLSLHLTGTEFYEPVDDPVLAASGAVADMDLPSESPRLYRGEYLAYRVMHAAERGENDLDLDKLDQAQAAGELDSLVATFAAPRYREGYLKGVHDQDASRLLAQLLPLRRDADLLRYGQAARALALLWLAEQPREAIAELPARCRQALALQTELGAGSALQALRAELAKRLTDWARREPPSGQDAAADPIDLTTSERGALAGEAADYLSQLLAVEPRRIHIGREAQEVAEGCLALRRGLGWRPEKIAVRAAFDDHLRWMAAYAARHGGEAFTVEAAMAAALAGQLKLETAEVTLAISLDGLLGQHPRIDQGKLALTLDDFLSRAREHTEVRVPAFEAMLSRRSELLADARERLRLKDFQARPLTTFVRNKLISDSYLPLIGANFAKQMGALGDNKRTDQMGMLLLISPPGYGKTTLIEYIASALGLVFVKVDCPSIGHAVTSLDPAQAPNSTARRELEKLNLALEMGNNVLLYLDDIQHTNPELLQRFISLSDATRRIEGVWRGKARTYDMRGKRFAVIMAGNPYTESGETFRIPDMLANRADIYNLGDMLSDQRDAFELSYIENALTSNPVLAPLATRELDDLYRFVQLARGFDVALSDMSHDYSQAEAGEIVDLLQRLLKVQRVVLGVNQAYIASSATAEGYRTEPPFKLQGSYRNMNKLAEKVVAVMTDDELNRLLLDHYQGEAQTLGAASEENLLKLGELMQALDETQAARWEEIKARFRQALDLGSDDDPDAQMVGQLDRVNRNLGVVAYSLYQQLKLARGDEGDSEQTDRARGIEPPANPDAESS